MSAVATASAVRFHLGLHTSDLSRAVQFYRALFGTEPAKHYDDYARFEVEQPALVLALYPSPREAGGALNHVGLRLPDSAALVEVQRRLEEQGVATQREEGVECCYSRQTKFWVADPDRVLWEVYTLHEDLDHSGFDDPPVTGAPVPQQVWEHRLTDPWPDRIDHTDGALDEVRLEGSFNAPPSRVSSTTCFRRSSARCAPAAASPFTHLSETAHFPARPGCPVWRRWCSACRSKRNHSRR
jgi:catechol 2,3-dioxygenase-like lactoylglutathione lyase family enzyme